MPAPGDLGPPSLSCREAHLAQEHLVESVVHRQFPELDPPPELRDPLALPHVDEGHLGADAGGVADERDASRRDRREQADRRA